MDLGLTVEESRQFQGLESCLIIEKCVCGVFVCRLRYAIMLFENWHGLCSVYYVGRFNVGVPPLVNVIPKREVLGNSLINSGEHLL
jgi:hypothetical protein